MTFSQAAAVSSSRAAAASDPRFLSGYGPSPAHQSSCFFRREVLFIFPQQVEPFLENFFLANPSKDALNTFPAEEPSSLLISGSGEPGSDERLSFDIRALPGDYGLFLLHIVPVLGSAGLQPTIPSTLSRGSVLSISKIVMRVELLLFILFISVRESF